MVDGSAASARTTTSKEGKLASDARNPSPMKIAMESQIIWFSEPASKKSSRRLRKKQPLKSMTTSTAKTTVSTSTELALKPTKREQETGLARDAWTTISVSEKCATCATWARPKARKSLPNNKTQSCSAKPSLKSHSCHKKSNPYSLSSSECSM